MEFHNLKNSSTPRYLDISDLFFIQYILFRYPRVTNEKLSCWIIASTLALLIHLFWNLQTMNIFFFSKKHIFHIFSFKNTFSKTVFFCVFMLRSSIWGWSLQDVGGILTTILPPSKYRKWGGIWIMFRFCKKVEYWVMVWKYLLNLSIKIKMGIRKMFIT